MIGAPVPVGRTGPVQGIHDTNRVVIDPAERFGDRVLTVAKGTVAASGDTTIISAVSGKYVYILSMFIVNNDDTNADVSLQETGSATDIFPKATLPAFGGQLDKHFSNAGLRQTTLSTGLDINVSNAGASPSLSYYVEYYSMSSTVG